MAGGNSFIKEINKHRPTTQFHLNLWKLIVIKKTTKLFHEGQQIVVFTEAFTFKVSYNQHHIISNVHKSL